MKSRKHRLKLILWVVLSAGFIFALGSDMSGGMKDPVVAPDGEESVIAGRLLQELGSRPAGERVAVWVFFRDRGFRNQEEIDRAMRDRKKQFSSRVIRRRSKTLGDQVVLRNDLPLRREYVDRVLSTGSTLRHRSKWLNGISIEATPEMIREIASLPFVARIQRVASIGTVDPLKRSESGEKDGGTAERFSSTLDYGPSQGQIEQINVVAVHDSGYSGSGVIVMMLDTGYYKEHESLVGQEIIAEWDFIFNDGETQNEPEDVSNQHDHGTATWSALGGYMPGQLIGPAYGASFLLAKTEDLRSETPAEEDNYVAALEWGDSLGVDVSSASLAYLDFDVGYSDYTYDDLDGNTAVISVAIDQAARRGIVVCNSASNNGPGFGTIWTPADADSMLAVGAVDPDGNITDFSSRGPTSDGRIKPEVVARGSGTYAAAAGGGYGWMGGTSLSNPLVGGSAALLLEAHPEWSPMEVREALMATASRAHVPDNAYGSGLINVLDAIYEEGIELTPSAFSVTTPAEGDTVSANGIGFEWTASIDPIGRGILYKLMIATDSLFNDPIVVWDIDGNSYAFADTLPEGDYFWKVFAYTNQSIYRESSEILSFYAGGLTSAGDGGPGISLPRAFGLGQNFPNPFNPQTTISFDIAGTNTERIPVRLEIFSIRGRLLRTLFDGDLESGYYQFSWDGMDDAGLNVPSGVYIYRLDAGTWSSTRKMVLSK